MKQAEPLIKIAIVGPESTGKSELAAALALHYKTVWVKEYARDCLTNLNRDYDYHDLLKIAQGQMQTEDETASKRNQTNECKILFCDTNLTVIKIWSNYKYQKCEEWITSEIKKRHYDLHLLTDIDLPWQADPLRENPDNRKKLFELYYNELQQQQVKFEVVSGLGTHRINNAITVIDKLIIKSQ